MTPRDPYTPWKIWAALALAFILLPMACQPALAEPVLSARLKNGAVIVTLYDEPCALEALSGSECLRATWAADGVPVEGCWALARPLDVVIFYFVDRTLAAVHTSLFRPVEGT